MIGDKPLHGTLDDGTETETFGSGSFGQKVTIVPGYASYGTDGEMGGIVGSDVVMEELAEILDDKLSQWLAVDMLSDKCRERCEETVRHRLTVHLINNSSDIEVGVALKGIAQGDRQQSLVEGIDEETAQDGPATLVAKDIAECRCVADNMVAVIETGVGSGTQNAGYARRSPKECTSRSKEVAIHFNIKRLKCFAQQSPRGRNMRLRAPCAIEEDGVG